MAGANHSTTEPERARPGSRDYFESSRITWPPFITNFTRSSSVMSFSGSPETAMMSANFPFSIEPTRSCHPIISAATVVAA